MCVCACVHMRVCTCVCVNFSMTGPQIKREVVAVSGFEHKPGADHERPYKPHEGGHCLWAKRNPSFVDES